MIGELLEENTGRNRSAIPGESLYQASLPVRI